MFCKQCGTEQASGAKYCPECGNSLAAANDLPVTSLPNDHVTAQTLDTPSPVGGHTKTTALLLALFFGALTFLYTREKDLDRLVGHLVVSAFFLFGGLVMTAAPEGPGASIMCFVLFNVSFWLVPVLRTAMRTQAWFNDYSRTYGAK